MIDEDDVTWIAVLFSGGGGIIGAIIFVIAVAVTAWIASDNEIDCQKKTCPSGQTPQLTHHDCFCLEKAK